MDLLQGVLIQALKEGFIEIKLNDNVEKIANNVCFMSLHRIKAVIENDSLSDFECIEEIVSIFEDIGCGCDGRHDFG